MEFIKYFEIMIKINFNLNIFYYFLYNVKYLFF